MLKGDISKEFGQGKFGLSSDEPSVLPKLFTAPTRDLLESRTCRFSKLESKWRA